MLIPIFAGPPHDVVFIERARHLRRHAGEIGLPGGAADAADAGDFARTALREAEEEVGIPTDAVTIVGRLPSVRQSGNAFTVSAFVGIVHADPDLVADENEVAATHRVPLAAIVAPGAIAPGVEVVGERRIETFQFDYGSLHIWGLTGRILASFVERYHARGSLLRAALDEQLVS